MLSFLSLPDSNKAFSRGYGLPIADLLGVEYSRLQRFIEYRKFIVHVTPTVDMLNLMKTPKEKPIFSSPDLVADALSAFDAAVEAINAKTLELQRRKK